MMKQLFCICAWAVLCCPAFAQDGLVPLRYNRALMQENVPAPSSAQRNVASNNTFIFLLDSLDLPFVDDFTERSIKQFSTDLYTDTIQTSVQINFTVNGDTLNRLEAMLDTSYTYTFNTNTNTWDSAPNPLLSVIFLDSAGLGLNQPVLDTDTLWAIPAGRLVNGVLLTDSIDADTIFFNRQDTTFFLWHENDGVRWVSNSVFVNGDYGVLEPSFGVATFDGVDSLGVPYSPTFSRNAYGLADVFTSAPIRLLTKPLGGLYSNADSLYMSFMYQSTGWGDEPEEDDSLVLEFYSPDTDEWIFQWKSEGKPPSAFEHVMIKIQNGNFFRDNFRFRFKNYASIAGNFDHWNIDYVRVGANRSIADTTIDDVAFVGKTRGLLSEYSKMPWQHYRQDSSLYVSDTASNLSYNLSPSSKLVVYQIRVLDDGNVIFQTDINQNVEPVFQSRTFVEKDINIAPFRFPIGDTAMRKTFRVENILRTQPDDNSENDTLVYAQDFGTFYAYDDGIPEGGYYVESPGANILVEYNLNVVDTLRAINIHFPRTLENITQNLFRLQVWSGAANSRVPQTLLYESALENPQYTVGRNLVARYDIPPLEVTGKIFVGFEQSNDAVFVGYDRNFNSRRKIFYNVDGTWRNASFTGSVMIHPEFDSVYYPWTVGREELTEEQLLWKLYPNPASQTLTIAADYQDAHVQILDLTGRLWRDQPLQQGSTQLDIADWAAGTYLVRLIRMESGTIETRKLIITR